MESWMDTDSEEGSSSGKNEGTARSDQKFCDMPDMSWTMLSSVVVLQYPMDIPSPSVNYFHLLVIVVPATYYHG